ncbi:MAG: Dolichyl-phosphate-mannose-protein mannosyltransferase [Actinomycetia bacterium]|nr:Dolichyl-phosphate-mannose-protein mannosyltransferase [Actinomycetes bacterium]
MQAPAVTDPGAGRSRRRADPALVLIALLALVIRIPAFFATRVLSFDDGVYGASAVAMRHGGIPFRDVFSSQPPLFLPLVSVFDALGMRRLDSPRLLSVVSGVLVVIAVWGIAHRLGGRRAAIIAALLMATSGCLLWTTGPLTSDGTAEVFAAFAVLVAVMYRDSPTFRRALVVGLLLGAGVAVKLVMLGPAAVACVLLLLSSRRFRDLAIAVGTALAVVVVVSVPFGIGDVWNQSVRYHLDTGEKQDALANLRKTSSTLGDRDVPLLLGALVALIGLFAYRRPRDDRGAHPRPLLDRLTGGVAPIVCWLVLALVAITAQTPMWRNHLAHLVVPACVLVGVGLAPVVDRFRKLPAAALGVLGVLAVAALGYHVVHLSPLLWDTGAHGSEARVVRALRALPPGAQAISDDPGVVWRAGRRTPDDLVDASILRQKTSEPSLRITSDTVVKAAAKPEVCAVAVRSGVRWGSFPDLPARLEAEGYQITQHYGGARALYVKQSCAP